LDKNRGGTPTGERALQGACRAPSSVSGWGAEVAEQRLSAFRFLFFISSLRGAKRRSNPERSRHLDCFASLAMTPCAAPIVMTPAIHCRISSDEDRIRGVNFSLAS
jgi:hypothetical protein